MGGLQVVEEGSARLTAFGCVGAMDAVGELGHADRAERRCAFADPRPDEFEKARYVETLPLGLDHDARIEDYSQEGGFHGSLRSVIPSSTSALKPSSGTAAHGTDSIESITSGKAGDKTFLSRFVPNDL